MLDCVNCSFTDALLFPDEDDRSSTETRDAVCGQKKEADEDDNNTALNTLKERDSLVMQLEQAKREIKMLRKERKLNVLEIERLKEERQQVQNALGGIDSGNRDVLDRVFDW
jgi:hypothetical protein